MRFSSKLRDNKLWCGEEWFFQRWGGAEWDRRWHSISQCFCRPQFNMCWRIYIHFWTLLFFSPWYIFGYIIFPHFSYAMSSLQWSKKGFSDIFGFYLLKRKFLVGNGKSVSVAGCQDFLKNMSEESSDKCSNGIANVMFHGLRQEALHRETTAAWGVCSMSQQALPKVLQVHRKSNICTVKTSANPHSHNF